ncbi:MAG: hypothetical protein ABI183_07930 [Polyangiaceae bacterium]
MTKRVGVAVTIPLFFAGFVTTFVAACDDTPTHIFYGQEYNETLGCLESVTVIDTIAGNDTGQSCALVCVASPPDPEASTTVVYASTTCPPYPPLFDVSGNDPQCLPALAAAKSQTTCLDDGGVVSTNPSDAATTNDAEVSDATSSD